MQVIGRDAAFACTLKTAGNLAAAVERFDGWTAQRPEAHAGHVDDRGGPECLGPLARGAQHLGAWHRVHRIVARLALVRRRQRKGLVFDDEIARDVLHLVVRPEAEIVVLALGRGIHPSTLIAAERPLFVVVGHDVLPQLGADGLEPVPEMTDDGEIAKDGMRALCEVVQDPHHKSRGERRPEPHGRSL